MKRILFIALLFVNLQIVMTKDGLSFTSMTASAQDMMYEMLDEVVVESQKVQCPYCTHYYEAGDMEQHQSQCSAAPTSCPQCGQMVLRSELDSGSHHCHGSENNNDTGNNSNGSGNSGGSGGGRPPGHGGSYGGSSGGGLNVGGGSSPPPSSSSDTSPKVGEYYKPKQGEHFFKDSVMALPLQDTTTTCVSTSLAYAVMWVNNLSVEKFDSVKKNIERQFSNKYGRKLSEDGVNETILDEFVTNHSNTNAQFLAPSKFNIMLSEGYPIVVDINKYNSSKDKHSAHLISVIGYDDTGNYVCKDPEKKELIYYSLDVLQFSGFSYYVIKK